MSLNTKKIMSKTKKNVVKLVMTADESRKWKKSIVHKKKILDDFDDEEDPKIDAPKAILQQVVSETTKVVTPGDGIISKMFTYEEADVIVIMDKDKNYWYRSKDICDILEYGNARDAMKRYVSNEYKKSYADISVGNPDALKIHPQTIFIDESGFFQLVSRSKKPEAIKLWQKITKEILPTLFTTGTYTLPPKQIDIDRLMKSFYDDNILSQFDNKQVVYLAYVGKHIVIIHGISKEYHVIKFGITRKIAERDLDQHRKYYKVFNVLGIWETLANAEVEDKLKTNFASKCMLIDLKIKGLNKTKEDNKREHAIINEVNGLDYCLNMIANVVEDTLNPLEVKYQQEIKDLKHKNEILETKYNASLKDIQHLETEAENLKNNINDLRKTIKLLE